MNHPTQTHLSLLSHLTDKALLSDTLLSSQNVKLTQLHLLFKLTEVYKRILYCDLGYSSLYAYITNELKFCDSQGIIFYQIILAKLLELPEVRNSFEKGEISLHRLSVLAREINFELIEDDNEKLSRLEIIKHSNKEELKLRLHKSQQKSQDRVKLELDQLLINKLEQVNHKLKLNLGMTELIHFLADEKLGLEVSAELKSITPKIRRYLFNLAHYQCQYVTEDGIRCSEKSF